MLLAKEAVSDDRLAALLVTVIGRQHDDAARPQPGAISWRCTVGLRSSISGRNRIGGRRGRHASQHTADRRRPRDARGAARLSMLHGVPDHRIGDRPPRYCRRSPAPIFLPPSAQPVRDSRPLYMAAVRGAAITPHDPPIFCPALSGEHVCCRHTSLCRRWRMRDLAADWRRWSAGERVLAVVVMGALIGLPVVVWF